MASAIKPLMPHLTDDDAVKAIRRPSFHQSPGNSRRGSGSITTPSGLTLAYHTRTQDEHELPHATKKTMTDHLRKYESLFTLTPQRMRMIVDAFDETLEKGLAEYDQVVPMIPTFVFGWPHGEEAGDYLAVDLGGTNLRVCLVTLLTNGKFEITQTKYRLTEEQKQEDGEKLFDFCAECLKTFIQSNLGEGLQLGPDGTLPLGFTFSYPCAQDRIDHGKLIRWTKGFGAPNTEGHDVAEMFRKSLEKANVPIKLTALINDTTGTLIASSYVNPRTKIAVILGTGCNAAYMEKISNIGKIKHLGLPDDELMAINCEWGAFDSFEHQHLPRTKYDVIVDETSNKPGEQAFEKLISGRYLGEILRLIICELIDEGVLFLGQNTYKIEKAYSFDTAFLSLMESDPTDELLTIVGIFTHFYGIETTLAERQFFRALAKLVGRRAARLSACGIAALVTKGGYLEEGCSVAADGSLYGKYPGFADRVQEALLDIFGDKGKNILTHHAEDGSGMGAALIAAMTAERRAKNLYIVYDWLNWIEHRTFVGVCARISTLTAFSRPEWGIFKKLKPNLAREVPSISDTILVAWKTIPQRSAMGQGVVTPGACMPSSSTSTSCPTESNPPIDSRPSMFDELGAAGVHLKHALEKYHDACSRVDIYCRTNNLTTATLDRLSHEVTHFNAFTRALGNAGKLILRSHNYPRDISSIHSLPPEILTHILDLAVRLGHETCEDRCHSEECCYNRIHQQADVLAQVSFRWRNLMLTCPTFWSRIYIDYMDNPDARRFFLCTKLWIQRSSSVPLDIYISAGPGSSRAVEGKDLKDLLQSTANRRLGSLSFILYGLEHATEDAILTRYFSNWGSGTLKELTIKKPGILPYVRAIKSAWKRKSGLNEEALINLPHDHLEALLRPITTLRLQGIYIDWGSQAYHGLVELCLFNNGVPMPGIPTILKSRLLTILKSSPGLRIIRFGIMVQEDISDGLPIRQEILPVQLDHLQILDLNPSSLHYGTIGCTLRSVLGIIVPGPQPLELLLPRNLNSDEEVENRRELRCFFARSRVTQLSVCIRNPTLNWLLSSTHSLRALAIRSNFGNTEVSDQESKGEMEPSLPFRTINRLYMLGSVVAMDVFHQWMSRYPEVRTLVFWRCVFFSGDRSIPEPDVGQELGRSGLLDICPDVNVVSGPCPIFGWDR